MLLEVVRRDAKAQAVGDAQNPIGRNVGPGQRDAAFASRDPPSSLDCLPAENGGNYLATVRVAAFTSAGVKMCVSFNVMLCVTQSLVPLNAGTA